MLSIAIKMLLGDRAKFVSLLLGIAFASFLIAFAISYFAGFMSRSYALIEENPQAQVWVMDPAVRSVDQTINIPANALLRVRSVAGVVGAAPLALGTTDARFPDGRFQSLQVIGVDDATLGGIAPTMRAQLRRPQIAFLDAGGTEGKLVTTDPGQPATAGNEMPTRPLKAGDELRINDRRVLVGGISDDLRRFPPRPLLVTTFSNAVRILPPERHQMTLLLVSVRPDADAKLVASAIERETGLRARTSADFKSDTVWWLMANSEDVGDIAAMLSMAILIGFGVTGVMLYIFTIESLGQYAVLKALGAKSRVILAMVFAQAAVCGALGAGIGLGLCTLSGYYVSSIGYPFRMMWPTPVAALTLVLLVCVVAALLSVRPVLRLSPATVFAGR